MKLIFVYNAKSGLKHSVLDTFHKILSPSTYKCNLCALTFDRFSENKVWREFREGFKIDLRFLHSDEFENEFPSEQFQYPTILNFENNKLKEIITSDEINKIKNLNALIERIKTFNFSAETT